MILNQKAIESAASTLYVNGEQMMPNDIWQAHKCLQLERIADAMQKIAGTMDKIQDALSEINEKGIITYNRPG